LACSGVRIIGGQSTPPGQTLFDGFKQLGQSERLFENRQRPEFFGDREHFAAQRVSRDGDNAHVGGKLSQLHHGLDAILFGHEKVGDDEIGGLFTLEVNSFDAVGSENNSVPGGRQSLLQSSADALLVIDHQDACHEDSVRLRRLGGKAFNGRGVTGFVSSGMG
jgi:hypothetical protein